MRATVQTAWPAFVSRWEGRVPFLYLDTKRLATFGLGNMVDGGDGITEYGLVQPWRDDTTGKLVTEARIRDEYTLIHTREDLAPKGGWAYRDVATLHLDDAAIDAALWDTTSRFWTQLGKTLPDLEKWPADAQLALLNMAWNLGPGFLGANWPLFTAAAKAGDFAGCATNCLRAVKSPRDYVNRGLFHFAAGAVLAGDITALHT